jgi:hypothetical protein
MKKKMSFVTNSSSASFILHITSAARSLDQFKEIMKLFLSRHYAEKQFDYQRIYNVKDYEVWSNEQIELRLLGTIKEVGNIYKIYQWVGMFNDATENIPDWMNRLIIEQCMGKYIPGIEKVTLTIEED